MQLVMSHAAMGGERFEDEDEVRVGEDAGVSGGSAGETSEEQLAMGRGGNGGAIRDRPVKVIPCPRCQSMNTKFCYYNNYSVAQPRHFCRNCQRYWTVGGTLRNVPVGGGSRKKTRTRSRSDPYGHIPSAYDSLPQSSPLLIASTCMAQQLSMLPPTLNAFTSGAARVGPFPSTTTTSHLPFLDSRKAPLPGLQEVPDLQSFYDNISTPPPLLINGMSFFPQQSFPSPNEPFVSVMAKAGLWSSAPMQTPTELSPSFAKPQMIHQLGGGGYGQTVVTGENSSKPAFWDVVTPATQTRLMMDDRLVPHASWEDTTSNPSTAHNTPNLSPNGSSTTDHSMPHHPSGSTFSHHHYCDDASQPWVGLHAADILNF